MVKQLVLGIESMDSSLQTAAQGEQLAELSPFLCSFHVLSNIISERMPMSPPAALCVRAMLRNTTVCDHGHSLSSTQEPLAICGYCATEESRFSFHFILIKCRSPQVVMVTV